MLGLAQLAVRQGKESEGLQWLEKAANADAKAFSPRAMLAQYWMARKNADKALIHIKEAVNADPDNPQALYLLGQVQAAKGDLPNAVGTYKKLTARAPRMVQAHIRLAAALLQSNDTKGSRLALDQALKVDPANVDAKRLLIGLALRDKDYARALELAHQVQKAHPKAGVGFALEGEVLMAQRQFKAAAKRYETAYGLGSSGTLAINLHHAYAAAGDRAKGERRIGQWLAEHPQDVAARMYLAEAQLKAGQFPQAAAQYETSLKQNPKNLLALNNLAWLYQQLHDPRAVSTAEQAYTLQPDNPAVADTLGWILIERGDPKRGLELVRKALAKAKAPEAAEMRYHLAVGLDRAGNKAQARTELQALIRSGRSFSKLEEAKALLGRL
jgi:putative PEP-CTERM system TPR-repeat lipoprotein